MIVVVSNHDHMVVVLLVFPQQVVVVVVDSYGYCSATRGWWVWRNSYSPSVLGVVQANPLRRSSKSGNNNPIAAAAPDDLRRLE